LKRGVSVMTTMTVSIPPFQVGLENKYHCRSVMTFGSAPAVLQHKPCGTARCTRGGHQAGTKAQLSTVIWPLT
jgi:hypothetical protein